MGVVPAGPCKAKLELGVQLAERWIIATLRHRQFFSIEELNQALKNRKVWPEFDISLNAVKILER